MYLFLFACMSKKNVSSDVPESEDNIQETTKEDSREDSTEENVQKPERGVVLDGQYIDVRWDDGDTFSGTLISENGKERIKARLNGYNTLESYGPVHSWGDWTPEELYVLAKKSGAVANEGLWECTDMKSGGGYGRKLIDCPQLRRELLLQGLAHPFSVGRPASGEDVSAMKEAMDKGVGIWEKGAPKTLITSLHSADEDSEKAPYNRICDLSTGSCDVINHTDTYAVCQKVCVGDSCMIYVPYLNRYKEEMKAECIK